MKTATRHSPELRQPERSCAVGRGIPRRRLIERGRQCEPSRVAGRLSTDIRDRSNADSLLRGVGESVRRKANAQVGFDSEAQRWSGSALGVGGRTLPKRLRKSETNGKHLEEQPISS